MSLTIFNARFYSTFVDNVKNDILKKLHNHLNNGINCEADVVYLFIEIGKYLEQNKNFNFPLIKFYRNWIAHSQINNTHLADDISTALNQALTSSEAGDGVTMIKKVMEVISKERLKKELGDYFDMTSLPKDILNIQSWKDFLRLLVGVLIDVPVEFVGLQKLKSFEFKKDHGSNYILCEVNGSSGGITFIWTQLYSK